MSKNPKPRPKRLAIGKSTDCTSYGIAKKFSLADFHIPHGLYCALKSRLDECATNTKISRSYISCIKSLSNVKKIKPEEYLLLYKIFLYMEHYVVLKAAKQHSLRNYKFKEVDQNNRFSVQVPNCGDEDTLVEIGDEVKIKEVNTRKTYYGKVIGLEGGCASICLMNNKDVGGCYIKNWKFLFERLVNIRFVPTNFPVKCCHFVLNTLFKHNLANWLYPKVDPTCSPALDRDLDWLERSVGQNAEQRQAVLNILNKSCHPAPYILFGPPGTGKTSTLVEAICQIWKRDRSEYILVCAQSNAAANEVTKRLLKVIPDKEIYRMYTASCKGVPKEIDNCSNIVDETIVFLPKEIVLLKRIVVATLVTSIRLTSLNLRSDHFSYIFIDEASQSVEPETLIPATLTIKNKDKDKDNGADNDKRYYKSEIHAQIVLAGDPYQLGPIVRCPLIRHLYGKSLIERLMDCEPYKKVNGKYNPCYVTKLVRNFRSRGPILDVSNKLFYENELKACAASNSKKISLEWPEVRNKTFPILFCSVKGTERRAESKSVYNQEEVTVVIRCVTRLLDRKLGAKVIKQNDIGIVTPFREQQFRIRDSLQDMNVKCVTIGTVEIFQGQEKPVIIFSTVRSQSFVHDGVEHIGHLSNPKRFNVGLTRAQLLLIVIGNPDVLCTEDCWKELVLYCQENDAFINIDPRNIDKEFPNIEKTPASKKQNLPTGPTEKKKRKKKKKVAEVTVVE